jgi:hypothetical protein
MIGSYDYYIEHQIQLARDEQAPADAIYQRDDGTWATTDEILRSDTRRQLGLEPLPFQEPEPSALLAPLRQAVLWIEAYRDRYGMTDVEQLDDHTLLIWFATGWRVRLTLECLPPGSPD